MSRTWRVYADGQPTPAATVVDDGSDARVALPVYGLSAGSHELRVTVQEEGQSEGPLSAPTTVTIASLYQPTLVAAQGATLAKVVGLRALFRSRYATAAMAGESIKAGPVYDAAGTWANDYEFSTAPYPGVAPWQKLRGTVDAFLAHVGEWVSPLTGQPMLSPPTSVKGDDASHWVTQHTTGTAYKDFAKAANIASLVCRCHRLGDPTAWNTHKVAIETALAVFPEVAVNGGLLHYDNAPATADERNYHWWDEAWLDKGNIGVSAVEFCRAYLDMKAVALSVGDSASAAAYQARVDAFTLGLASLRITSGEYAGFYQPSTHQAGNTHVGMTAEIVSLGLCGASERAESANAIVSMYLAGRLNLPGKGGFVRQLVYPQYGIDPWARPDTQQNGTYWSAEHIPALVAHSMQIAGRDDLAEEMFQQLSDEFLRQHRYNRHAPWEYLNAVGLPGPAYPSDPLDETLPPYRGEVGIDQVFASGWTSSVAESLPASVDITLSGASGSESSALSLPHGHLFAEVEVLTEQAATISVDLLGNEPGRTGGDPRTGGDNFPSDLVVASAAYVPMVTVTLNGATQGSAAIPSPIASHGGGGLKAKIAAGSTAGTVTMRLKRRTDTPRLIPTPAPPSDPFDTDTGAAYRVVGDTWAFGGGVATTSGSGESHILARAVPPAVDAKVRAVFTPSSRAVRLFLRWRDAQNYCAAEITNATHRIIQCVAGTTTEIASWYQALSGPQGIEASVADNTCSVKMGVATYTGTVHIHSGLVGFGGASGSGALSIDSFEVISRSHYVPSGFLIDKGIGTGYIHDDDTSALGAGTYTLRSPEGADLATLTTTAAGVVAV